MNASLRRASVLLLLLGAAAVPLACSSTNENGEDVGTTDEAYTSDCPDGGTVLGIDVYDGQGKIDWARVKSGDLADGGDGGPGRDFAIIKATQGTYNQQDTFAYNWSEAKKAGLLRSAYHFFDPTKDGAAQAAYFLAMVGSDIGELPPTLDIECPTSATQSAASKNCEYTGNSGWVDPAVMKTRIFDWLDAVEKATGKKALIYSYPSWFAALGMTDAKLAEYPLYIATYDTCASVPAPWTSTVFWQYSSTGTVPGITGTKNVDVDKFMGTLDDLTTFAFGPEDAGSDASKPPPVTDAAPPPEPTVDSGSVPVEEAPPPPNDDGGCGCETVGAKSSRNLGGLGAFVALGLVAMRRRRRR
ncbi:MAG TPA: GH25 family lysozyme [Polyangiaceae bacterium]